MSVQSSLPDRIREVRGSATQAAFSRRLGVDTRTVRRWEDGSLVPNGHSLLSMIDSYGVDANWLLAGRGKEPGMAISRAEQQIVQALRTKGEAVTEGVFSLLGLDRYCVERQDHLGDWQVFDTCDNLEEALAKAKEGFRRVIDLHTGQTIPLGNDSPAL